MPSSHSSEASDDVEDALSYILDSQEPNKGPFYLNPRRYPPEVLGCIIDRVKTEAETKVSYVSSKLGYEVKCCVCYDGKDFVVVTYEPLRPGPSEIPDCLIEEWGKIEALEYFLSRKLPDFSTSTKSSEEEEDSSREVTNDTLQRAIEETTDPEGTQENKPQARTTVSKDRIRDSLAVEIDWGLQGQLSIFHGLRVRIPISAGEYDNFYENTPFYYRCAGVYSPKAEKAREIIDYVCNGGWYQSTTPSPVAFIDQLDIARTRVMKEYRAQSDLPVIGLMNHTRRAIERNHDSEDQTLQMRRNLLVDKFNTAENELKMALRMFDMVRNICDECYLIYSLKIWPLNFPRIDALSGMTGDLRRENNEFGIYLGSVCHIRSDSECYMCRFLLHMAWGPSNAHNYHIHVYSGFGLLFSESIPQYKSHLPDWSQLEKERKAVYRQGELIFGLGRLENRKKWRKDRFQQIESDIAITKWQKGALQDTHFLAVVPDAPNALRTSEALERSSGKGFFVNASFSSDLFPGVKIFGREIDNHHVDYTFIKRWMRLCLKDGCLTHRRSPKTKIPLFLLSCMSGKVVPSSYQTEYIALSYVWGPNVASHQPPERVPPYTIPESRPATIEDAMTLVRRLGYEYLWVDMYCISSDPSCRHNQIARMDLVYKSAQMTIVAAAGSDMSYGLPGVGSRGRVEQATVRVGPNYFVETQPYLHGTLRNSVYSTRGWTYQEEFFSLHKLIFTDSQVVYQCPRGIYHEKLEVPKPWFDSEVHPSAFTADFNDEYFRRFSDSNQLTLRKNIWPGFTTQGLKPPLLHFFEYHVTQYTSRKLTMSSDSLNAIESILSRFSSEKSPIYHLNGIPIQREPSQIWDVPKNRRPGDKRQYSMLYGLMWTHGALKRALQRRPDFPSWSWAGWEGTVTWLIEDTTDGKFHSAIDETKIFYADGNAKLPAGSWRNDSAHSAPKELIVSTKVFEVCIVSRFSTLKTKRQNLVWDRVIKIPEDEDLIVTGNDSAAHITLPRTRQSLKIHQPCAFPLGTNPNMKTQYLLLITFTRRNENGVLCAQRIGITETPQYWDSREGQNMTFILE